MVAEGLSSTPAIFMPLKDQEQHRVDYNHVMSEKQSLVYKFRVMQLNLECNCNRNGHKTQNTKKYKLVVIKP